MIYSTIGLSACALVMCAFYAKNALPMRAYAIASNIAFLGYAIPLKLWPIVALHGLLLPLNMARLFEILVPTNRWNAATVGPTAFVDRSADEDRWSDAQESDMFAAVLDSKTFRAKRLTEWRSVNIGYVIFATGLLLAIVSGVRPHFPQIQLDLCTDRVSQARPGEPSP